MHQRRTSKTPASHSDQKSAKGGFWRPVSRHFDRDVVEDSRLRRFCARVKTAVIGRRSLPLRNHMTAASNSAQGRSNTNQSENSKPSRRARFLKPAKRIWKKTKKVNEAHNELLHGSPDIQDGTVEKAAPSLPLPLATGRLEELEILKAFSVPMPTRVVPRSLYTYTIADTTQVSPERPAVIVAGNNILISPRRSSLAIERKPSATNNLTDTHSTPPTGRRKNRPLSTVLESDFEYETKPSRAGRFLAIPASNVPVKENHRGQKLGTNEYNGSLAFERSPPTAPDKAEQKRLARAVMKRPIRRDPIPENWQEIAEKYRLEGLMYKPLKGRTPIPDEWKVRRSPNSAYVDDNESVKSFVTAVGEQDEDTGETESKRYDSAAWIVPSAAQKSSTRDTAVAQVPFPTPVYNHSAVKAHTAGPVIRQRLASNPILLSRKTFTFPCAWAASARTRVAWV
jgi:hypothetical protein